MKCLIWISYRSNTFRCSNKRKKSRASGTRSVQVFMREALPSDLIATTLSEVGKQFSEAPRTPAEIEAYADAMADMCCACLKGLENG